MTSNSPDVEMLERERLRLEGLLQADANWRMLQDLARERAIEQFAGTAQKSDLIRSLETVLSTNRYYLARRKIVEAIELLSGMSATPPSPAGDAGAAIAPAAPVEVAATVSRALRKGIAERIVMLTPPDAPAATALADEPLSTQSPPRPTVARPVAWPGSDAERQAPARDRFELMRGMTAASVAALQDAGVTRFDAIAAWTASDVARMRLVVGDARVIAREGWIEQAAVLATGRETAYARTVKGGGVVGQSDWPNTHEGEPSDHSDLAALRPAASQVVTEPDADTLHFDAIESVDVPPEPLAVPAAGPQAEQIPLIPVDEPFMVLADHDAIRLDEPDPSSVAIAEERVPAEPVMPPRQAPAIAQPSSVLAAIEAIPVSAAVRELSILPSPVQSPETDVASPASTPVPEQTMMQRLAQLERDLAELDQVGKPAGLIAAAVTAVAQPQKPRPARGARSIDRHIEDEEFPELSVREADVVIVPGTHAKPSESTPTTQSMLRRQRQSEHLLEADSYAGYRTEIEEASVEIVRKSASPEAPGPAGGLPEVKASKASVQRFLKSLGNKP